MEILFGEVRDERSPLVRISIEKHSSGWPGLRNEYRHYLRQRVLLP
jgi:hypothetical protein